MREPRLAAVALAPPTWGSSLFVSGGRSASRGHLSADECLRCRRPRAFRKRSRGLSFSELDCSGRAVVELSPCVVRSAAYNRTESAEH